jgi:hypothetical protein
MTRVVQSKQLTLGEYSIEHIQFDPKSRDDVPQILQGLQYLYVNEDLRKLLFSNLEKMIPKNISDDKGRAGMDLWKIFVMGTLRVNLNWDYDRLLEMVNQHRLIRQMIGHGSFDDDYQYKLQTIKDNVRLLTPEILDKINEIVIAAGHDLVKKKTK